MNITPEEAAALFRRHLEEVSPEQFRMEIAKFCPELEEEDGREPGERGTEVRGQWQRSLPEQLAEQLRPLADPARQPDLEALLSEELGKLRKEVAEAVRLRLSHALTCEEIAGRLGISVAEARRNVCTGLSRLLRKGMPCLVNSADAGRAPRPASLEATAPTAAATGR